MIATIRANDSSIALINTFFVAPERADELMQLLIEATDTAMRHQPGFISANLHLSLDKKRIVNYAQWRSKEDFEAMQSNPAAKPHMQKAASIAERFEPVSIPSHMETIARTWNESILDWRRRRGTRKERCSGRICTARPRQTCSRTETDRRRLDRLLLAQKQDEGRRRGAGIHCNRESKGTRGVPGVPGKRVSAISARCRISAQR